MGHLSSGDAPTLDAHVARCEDVSICPWCESDELEDFADESGWYCYGCHSNIFRDELQSEDL